MVKELIEGRDGLVRVAKLSAGRGTLERAVQQLYPLELQCDRPKEPQVQLIANAPTFRPRRAASTTPWFHIQEALTDDD